MTPEPAASPQGSPKPLFAPAPARASPELYVIPPPDDMLMVTMSEPGPPYRAGSVKASGGPNSGSGVVNTSDAGRAGIGEAIEKEPIIQTLLDVFGGEVLSR